MRKPLQFLVSFITISIFSFSFFPVRAQQNTGVQARGAAPITRSVSEIMLIESKMPKTYERRDNEEEEEGRSAKRKMNPASPAVPSFGRNIQNRQSMALAVASNLRIHNNFLAGYIGDNGTVYYPPDVNGDISSSSQIMTTVNGRLKVYNVPGATGTPLTTTTGSSSTPLSGPVLNLGIDAFFTNSHLGINKITDPHVRFDRLSGRWFIIAADKNHNAQNYLCIAMSNTGTLTSTSVFSLFYLQSTTGSGTPTADWMDYPTLGVDKYALYVGANIFDKNTHATNKGSTLYLINKSSLISGTLSATIWQYGTAAGKSGSNGITGVGMLTPQGVQNDDPAATEGYFIATDWAAYGSLILKRVTNPGGTPSLSADMQFTVPTTAFSINQPALGTPGKINTFDDRLFAAMISKNKLTGNLSLWTAHNVEVNASGVGAAGGGRNGSRWYEIGSLNTTPSLIQSGTIFDSSATSPRGYFMPSMATNGQGHSLLGSSTSSAYRRIQAAYATRYNDDPAGTMQKPDTITTITSNYNPSSGLQRWGDYSQTVVDPKDNMTLWTFQEYTTNNNQWGLRAVQIIAPPPAQSPVATADSANFCDTAIAISISGSNTDKAGFFDPGDDAGGPGYNRLTITCSGGIPVTNTTFISPTQLSCVLHVSEKPAGDYTLTITNPDGQAVSSIFTLDSCIGNPFTQIENNSRKNAEAVTPPEHYEANFEVNSFPNPATDMVRVTIKSPIDQFVTESLVDFTGRKLFEKGVHLAKGTSEVQFSIASLPAGTYFFQVKNAGSQLLQTVKIIKA